MLNPKKLIRIVCSFICGKVAFYSYFLPMILNAYPGLQQRSSMGGGGGGGLLYEWDEYGWVWLWKPHWGVKESLESFFLAPWLQIVTEQLEGHLPISTFGGDIEDVPWQLVPTCRSCPYVNDCMARGHNRIEGLPYVSRDASRFLLQVHHDLHPLPPSPEPTLASLSDAISATTNSQILERVHRVLGSPILPSQTPPLLETFMDRRARASNRPYGLFPRSQDDVALSLVLAEDAFMRLPYGWALALQVKEGVIGGHGVDGPLLESLRSIMPQEVPCGKPGHITLVASGGAAFTHDTAALQEEEIICCTALMAVLTQLITLLSTRPDLKSQLYVWEGGTRTTLTNVFIRYAHEVVGSEGAQADAQRLALALLDSQGIWQMLDPPSVAVDAQFRSEGDLKQLTAKQLEAEGGLAPGTATVRGMKVKALEDVKARVRSRNESLMQTVPFICEVLPAYQALVYLPQPGFYTGSRVAAWARGEKEEQGMEMEDIEKAWMVHGDYDEMKGLLQARALAVFPAKDVLRQMVDPRTLFNDSGRLACADLGTRHAHPLLQRLTFMKQVGNG